LVQNLQGGRAQAPMKKKASGFTLIELLIVIAIIGILAAIAIPNLLNAVQRARQKRTMADIKALAVAIEAYHVDNSQYPAAACNGGNYTTTGTALTTDSFTNLTPTYIAAPPKTDGWGTFLVYGLDAAQVNYNVRSLGRNQVADATVCGTTTNFNDDILFSDGAFLQWPEGTQY
ncbi:MAG TPA: prepilin-type N-terminal cleavage/methylation domain-containing protein, partial [Thermoanaerobaculia bacterium]